MFDKIEWAEGSCCGRHRKGAITMQDGETLHITENDNGDSFSVMATKGGAVNANSVRCPSGFLTAISRGELLSLLEI